ncbi:MAG: MarR family transcriptional regulator [Devosia sp.]|uniref:MarR family winged helix-turn-helix transcriptional regulator n=1 Tax=Devosia sp. TaxID=1871048 RepID=UPI00260221B8|nr:MarR family transcriptional regulator [Devosia sp.]MDB5585862.1 MarR family transcriptional regulator [Devosia sp.]
MDQQDTQTLDCKPTSGIADVAPISKLIFSVTKQMRRVFEQQARLQDMTLPQWRALGQLVQSNGLSQAALSALIETDQMTTSKILRLLETRGLIERLPDPADSRAKIVRATPPVTAMVEAMKAVAGELHETMLEGISEADRQVLVRSLNKIFDNLTSQSDRQKDADK